MRTAPRIPLASAGSQIQPARLADGRAPLLMGAGKRSRAPSALTQPPSRGGGSPTAVALEEPGIPVHPSHCYRLCQEAESPGGTVWFSVCQPGAARCRGRSPAQPCGFGSRCLPRLEMSQGMARQQGF